MSKFDGAPDRQNDSAASKVWGMRQLRPRFKISTLLWLTTVAAAFLLGRRSEEIERPLRQWWQVTRVSFGAEADPKRRVVQWPPSCWTVNEAGTISQIQNLSPTICSTTLRSARQIQISPQADGTARVSYVVAGVKYPNVIFEATVENGKVSSDWSLNSK